MLQVEEDEKTPLVPWTDLKATRKQMKTVLMMIPGCTGSQLPKGAATFVAVIKIA